jgi:sugar diacid utilization regulator
MGFMDKVKAQATVLVDKAQTGVQQGQAKFQEMQSSRQADHLLRDLGAYVFLSERGRTQPDSEAKVAEIMSQLDALETAGTPITVGSISADNDQDPAAGATPAESATPPAGGAIPQSGGGLPQSGGGLPE